MHKIITDSEFKRLNIFFIDLTVLKNLFVKFVANEKLQADVDEALGVL